MTRRKYSPQDGERRLRALKRAGYTKLQYPCHKIKVGGEKQAKTEIHSVSVSSSLTGEKDMKQNALPPVEITQKQRK